MKTKSESQHEGESPRCPKHRTLLRTTDGYCWFTGHCVPKSEWVYGKEQPVAENGEPHPVLEGLA